MAVLKAAVAISQEPTTTQGHVNRKALATAVARDPISYAETFSPLVLAYNSNLSNESSDQALFDHVAAVWDTLAG